MGISVKGAKYMKAPATEAKRLAHRLLPPTKRAIQALGMMPSCPGLPSRKPATMTPPSKRGKICLAKIQEENVHSFSSAFLNQRTSTQARAASRAAPRDHLIW